MRDGIAADVLIAVGLAAAAFLFRLILHPWLADRTPFLGLYPALLAVAITRGWKSALLTLGLGGVLCWVSFIPHEGSLALRTVSDLAQLLAATFVCLVIIALAEVGRRARARATLRQSDLHRALGDLHEGRAALEQSRGLYRLILESATEFAIFSADLAGRVLTWNPGGRAVFGYDDREIVGQDVRILFTPEDREAGIPEQEMRNARERGRSEDERWHLRKDGSRFWASGALMPIRGPGGQVTGYLKIARDATEQRRAREELERRAQELARSNADLEEFAYIASHDLKEPLRGISNYAGFIIEDHAAKVPQDARERLEVIRRLCARMDGLLNSLLEYARAGRITLEHETCDLNQILDDVLDSLRPWMESYSARITVQPGLPTVPCDRHRIAQVFSNLITNAVKYSDKPERRIEIGALPAPGPASPVTLYIRDDGIGIDPRHADGIFRMFRRLHGRDQCGAGAGAGLTIVRKIVERHGGRIWVESTPGQGSTFYFTLASDPAAEPARPRPGPDRPTPGRDSGPEAPTVSETDSGQRPAGLTRHRD
ncbi:MAG: ATP-binding protein [Phycisphaerales bacterium]